MNNQRAGTRPTTTQARLTPARLFSDPPLAPALPSRLRLVPGGGHVTYLRVAADDRERMQLWIADVADLLNGGGHRLLLDAADLSTGLQAQQSIEDKAERERRRLFHGGIVDYQWHKSGHWLIVPIQGQIFRCNWDGNRISGTHQISTLSGWHSAVHLSAGGGHVSWVRDSNLYVQTVPESSPAAPSVTAVTSDTAEAVTNGLADFIAQEEMHRFDGHWWSPDDAYLAFCRVDESNIDISWRTEINAEDTTTVAQRYPYAGGPNAEVQLGLYRLATQSVEWLSWSLQPDDYLARVDFLGPWLVVQVQSRNQQQLYLRAWHLTERRWQEIRCESSDTWVNLHDNFTAIGDTRFAWTSEASGIPVLYVVQLAPDGSEVTASRLDGPHFVNAVLGANAERLWCTGWEADPTSNHLYEVPLDGSACKALTREPGWHECSVDSQCTSALVTRSSVSCPGAIEQILLQPTPAPHAANTNTVERQVSVSIFRQSLEAPHPYADYLGAHITPTFGSINADDGTPLYYRLTRPQASDGPHPVIVYVYGGPGAQRARNEWPPLLLQMLAHHGFGVMELDNRGSSGRGRAFEAPIYRHMGSVEVLDQLRGVDWLKQQAWVDPARIGVFGHSYGGYMTLMCLAKAPHEFAAGVAVAPVSDWALYDTHYTERYMGTPTDNADGYRASAVFEALDAAGGQLDNKLLLIHGMADDNVLFTHTTRILKRLQTNGCAFELMTYPGAKHALQERDVSTHRFNLLLDFFGRRLGRPWASRIKSNKADKDHPG